MANSAYSALKKLLNKQNVENVLEDIALKRSDDAAAAAEAAMQKKWLEEVNMEKASELAKEEAQKAIDAYRGTPLRTSIGDLSGVSAKKLESEIPSTPLAVPVGEGKLVTAKRPNKEALIPEVLPKETNLPAPITAPNASTAAPVGEGAKKWLVPAAAGAGVVGLAGSSFIGDSAPEAVDPQALSAEEMARIQQKFNSDNHPPTTIIDPEKFNRPEEEPKSDVAAPKAADPITQSYQAYQKLLDQRQKMNELANAKTINTLENREKAEERQALANLMAGLASTGNKIGAAIASAPSVSAGYNYAPGKVEVDTKALDEMAKSTGIIDRFDRLASKEKDDPSSPASAQMRSFLKSMGIQVSDQLSYGQGEKLFDRMLDTKDKAMQNKIRMAMADRMDSGKAVARINTNYNRFMSNPYITSLRNSFGRSSRLKAALESGNSGEFSAIAVAEMGPALDALITGKGSTITGAKKLELQTLKTRLEKAVNYMTGDPHLKNPDVKRYVNETMRLVDREEAQFEKLFKHEADKFLEANQSDGETAPRAYEDKKSALYMGLGPDKGLRENPVIKAAAKKAEFEAFGDVKASPAPQPDPASLDKKLLPRGPKI